MSHKPKQLRRVRVSRLTIEGVGALLDLASAGLALHRQVGTAEEVTVIESEKHGPCVFYSREAVAIALDCVQQACRWMRGHRVEFAALHESHI